MNVLINKENYNVLDLNPDLILVEQAAPMFNRSVALFRKACFELSMPVVSVRGKLKPSDDKNRNLYFVSQRLFMDKFKASMSAKDLPAKKPARIGSLALSSWNKIATAQNYIRKKDHTAWLTETRPPVSGLIVLRLNLIAYLSMKQLKVSRYDFTRLKSADKISASILISEEILSDYMRETGVEKMLLASVKADKVYALYSEQCQKVKMEPLKRETFDAYYGTILNMIRQDLTMITGGK